MKLKMKQLTILLIQILIYCDSINCDTEVEWIDPFNIEFAEPVQVKTSENQLGVITKDKTCDTQTSEVMAYYKRTINLILASVVIENADRNMYKGRLFVDIPIEDYTFLKQFANTNVEEPLTLQKVDHILTKVLTKSTIDELSDLFVYWSDYISFVIFNRTTGIYLCMFLVLIVVYKLLKASYTAYQVVIYLMFLGYLTDFVFTWKRMMQELEINKYADSLQYKNMPADCKLSDMSAWSIFLSYISGAKNCREYHKVILYDVFWDVGPLDVIGHQSRVILAVASNIGMAISKLTTGLMSDLPFPLNIIFLPFLFLFILILVMAILTYLIPTHLDLNIFHLISIKLKTNKPIKDASEGERKSRRELEEIEMTNDTQNEDGSGDGKRKEKSKMKESTKHANESTEEESTELKTIEH